jgi:hypothetical protein
MLKFNGPYQPGATEDISPEPDQGIFEFRVAIRDADDREIGSAYDYCADDALAIARLFAAAPAMYAYLRKAAARSQAAAEIVRQIEQDAAPQKQ